MTQYKPSMLLYAYVHRVEFQQVAQLLGLPVSAMAGGVTAEIQKSWTAILSPTGNWNLVKCHRNSPVILQEAL